MSEEKMYAVKNDEGKYWDFNDLDGFWELIRVSCPITVNEENAKNEAKAHGGHVVTLIEEPEKVVLTKEQAKIVDDAHRFYMPACYIHAESGEEKEELLMRAYVNGYTVASEKKYYVKVPHAKTLIYFKVEDVDDLGVAQSDSEGTWVEFTAEEIEHYGLGDCKRVEVTDDEQ